MPYVEYFFLGGADLEMEAIRCLLIGSISPKRIFDARLAWGAKASSYRTQLQRVTTAGDTAICIELDDDLDPGFDRNQIVWIDHHGERAGRDSPGSLRQVFERLFCPPNDWTRDYSLIEANDIGHIPAMLRLDPPASLSEMVEIRRRDRAAQCISTEEERIGIEAARLAELLCGGRLTVVNLPHARTATVADPLTVELGGPGYDNLLIRTPKGSNFFGVGPVVERLRTEFPGGWWGGDLPHRGFWGHPSQVPVERVVQLVESN